jgi:hypothetical protein
VPPDIVKKGINEIKISMNKSSAKGEERVTIMSGEKLLKGRNQAPWRRVFRGHPANKEEIVDGAYRIINMGKASYRIANLVYPLGLPSDNFVKIGLQAWVEKSDTPLAVAFRIANGKYVEIVTLEPNRIGLYFAKKSIRFDTTGKFHRYEATVKDGRFILNVDGKKVFDEKMVMRVNSPGGKLKHNVLSIHNLNSQSFIFGSLAEKGVGIARWKNIELIRRATDICLTDFKLELKFPHESYLKKYAKVNPEWNFELKAEKGKVTCNDKCAIKYDKQNIKAGKDGLIILDHNEGVQGFYLPLSIFKIKSPRIILAEWQIKLIEAVDNGSPFMISFKMINAKKENVYCRLVLCDRKIKTAKGELALPKSIANKLSTFRLIMDIDLKQAALWLDGKELGPVTIQGRKRLTPGIMFGDGSRLVKGKVALKYMKITAIKGKK